MVEPACPVCLGSLAEGAEAWSCNSCGASYRCMHGIPDLRTCEDAYLPNPDDWAFALRLEEAYDRLDFRGLLDLYYDLSPEVTPDQKTRQVAHILSAPARAKAWIAALGPDVPEGTWLDLGCGSGSFLATAGVGGQSVIGIDVAMRWLLVARKWLDEEGLSQIRLVCGNAERLPFADQSFAAVIAGDVIEHVADQPATLAEAHRVLVPGGRFFAATPNRFSLAPEPHVGVWGVGFLPRRWMAGYVRLVRWTDFRAIRTLTYSGWTQLLHRSPFEGASIRCPSLSSGDLEQMGRLKRRLALAYNRLASSRPGQWLMRAVGPLFHIEATRHDTTRTSQAPLPATRP